MRGVSSLETEWLAQQPDGDFAVFVVWSSQLGGAPRYVPDAMHLLPDLRARHYWDGERRVGDLFRTLRLGDDTLRLTAAAWDTYLLFDREARWPAGSPPPEPAWWEHQLGALPAERQLDAKRFAAKAAILAKSTTAGHPGSERIDPGAASSASAPPPEAPVLQALPVTLPGGADGIGFDDLRFAEPLGKLLVPGGRTGNLDLVDPGSRQVEAIAGFSSRATFRSGHGEGTTSADFGRGVIFAVDRTALELSVVDPATRSVVGRAALASGPDYVRWVGPTNEIWVTEPDAERIEVFGLPASGRPVPVHKGFVEIPGGPESLVIDPTRGRAFTHLWNGTTLAIDLTTGAITARWPNRCEGSRGIALDVGAGFLFAGCAEGRAVVLDVEHDGKVLDSLNAGAGVDIIDYDPRLRHLYLPGGRSATMAILGVAKTGKLSRLATVATADGAHCVVADDRHQAWVCDPTRGRLLVVEDTTPAVG